MEPPENNQRDIDKYIERVTKSLGENKQILRVQIKNKTKDIVVSIGLEPEGNGEFLEPKHTFELVLVVDKDMPHLILSILDSTSLWITPDWYGAVFQDGKGIVNY